MHLAQYIKSLSRRQATEYCREIQAQASVLGLREYFEHLAKICPEVRNRVSQDYLLKNIAESLVFVLRVDHHFMAVVLPNPIGAITVVIG